MLMYGPFSLWFLDFGSVSGSPRFYGHLTPFYCHTAEGVGGQTTWPSGHLATLELSFGVINFATSAILRRAETLI